MNKNQIPNLLAFMVLIGGENILDKSPDYILEKMERYLGEACVLHTSNKDEWKYGLDDNNKRILMRYTTKWKAVNDEQSNT